MELFKLQDGSKSSLHAIPISEDDEKYFSTAAGSTNMGSTLWADMPQALVKVVAVVQKLKLRLRNDNIGVLTLYAQVKGRSPAHTL